MLEHSLRYLIPLTAVFVACAPDGVTSVTAGASAVGEGRSALAWTPCSLASSAGAGLAECATHAVPLDWTHPDGPTTNVFVKRVRAASGSSKRQLWLVNGGPGESDAGFEAVVPELAALAPDTDFYLPDHRGTGRSSRLGCAAENADSESGATIAAAEWPACLASVVAARGAELPYFTVTQAAHDLGEHVNATRAEGQEVYVYATSYGTALAQRYLQLYPTQPSGVAMLGILPADQDFAEFDEGMDRAGRAALGACGRDPVCSARLGSDPASALGEAMAGFAAGSHCQALAAAGVTPVSLKNALGSLLYAWTARTLVFPAVRRFLRCSDDDARVLAHYVGFVQMVVGTETMESTPVLHHHILLSEFWPGLSVEGAREMESRTLFSLDSAEELAPLAARWPKYTHDRYAGRFPTTSVPLLMMNGNLDPATPLAGAKRLAATLQGDDQVFLEVPNGTHDMTSPTIDGSPSCIRTLLGQFVTNHGKVGDTSCLARMEPLDLSGGAPALASQAFGTSDAWGD